MAGDAFKKRTAGEPLEIPAEAYNAFIDAARADRARRGDQGAPEQTVPRESGIVLVKNTTEADLDRLAVLGIDAPIFTPEDNEQEFKNRVALKGVTPILEDHQERFAILLEPLAAGRIGLGMVQGVTPVRLYVTNEGHRGAGVVEGKTGYLCSQTTAPVTVLWKEAGKSENEEDLKWAIVAIRGGGGIAASFVWRAQVVGIYAAGGGAWVDFATSGWQAYVTANPLFGDGTPDEDTTLFLKLTAQCAEAKAGFRHVVVGNKIGYVTASDTADVPGQPADTKYNGWVLLHGGDQGATLAALIGIKGGPGIVVDDVTDPDKPKVSVDLANVTPPGLQFVDGAGDAGKLAVKPDTTKGVDVGADAGVRVDLAAVDPGLQFPGGDLAVLPNADKAIIVEAAGVGVVANTEKAIVVDGDGVGVIANNDYGIEVSGDGVAARLKSNGGIVFDAGEIAASTNVDCGTWVDPVGGHIAVHADGAHGIQVSGPMGGVGVMAGDGLTFGTGGDVEVDYDLDLTIDGTGKVIHNAPHSKTGNEQHFEAPDGFTHIWTDCYGHTYCAY